MASPDSARLVVVDIGNSHTKLGLIPPECASDLPTPCPVLKIATHPTALDELADWLPPERLRWLVATVHRQAEQRLAQWVQRRRTGDGYRRLQMEDLPIEICVDHPEQVGVDRLLAAVAVNRLRAARQPAIVIDAGSAITVDLVSGDGAFQGGAILPGLEMVATAMAEQTDLLPRVRYSISDPPPAAVGKSTVAAIQSGLFWGAIGGVRETVARISRRLGDDPQLFLAGGDAAKLATFLARPVQIVPELVLAGIALCDGAGGAWLNGPRR